MLNEAELKGIYEARIPILKAIGNWVSGIINTELEKKLGSIDAVDIFLKIPPLPRVKTIDSFLEKALHRKQKENPMEEITDQVGIRYVVLLQKDVSLIGEIIKSQDCWECRQDRDFEQERLKKPDFFSYQSDHYIVFNKEALNVGGIQVPPNIPCEIQVRTLLQHAYAEMSHDTVYKPSISIPDDDSKQVRRALAKGSALIETTDDVFEEIDRYLKEYSRSVNALFEKASALYKKLTSVDSNKTTLLGMTITDAYKEELNEIAPDEIDKICDKESLSSVLRRKRDNEVLYRDSAILIIYCLIEKKPNNTPKKWPIDQKYLKVLYTDMGKNPQAYGID